MLSSFCHGCSLLLKKKTKNIISNEEYIRRKDKHNSKYKINYRGTSGGMEIEAAIRLWKRSLDQNLQYSVMVSDGDANAYKFILTLNNNTGP